MRFFETILSGAALVAAALALEINDFPAQGVVAGQSYTVTYSPKDNTPTEILLRSGPSGNLNAGITLTASATGGSYTFTVPKDLADAANYALEVKQGDKINYSAQFPLSGGSGSVSSAVSSAVKSAVSSAKASASSATSSAGYAASSAASSASAKLSSAVASAVSSAHASMTAAPSAGYNSTSPSNSTLSHATLSTSASGTGSPKATGNKTTSGLPEATANGASALASSPLAFIFGAVAAFAYLA